MIAKGQKCPGCGNELCLGCQTCHTGGCVFLQKEASFILAALYGYATMPIRTQKILGLKWLGEQSWASNGTSVLLIKSIIQSMEEFVPKLDVAGKPLTLGVSYHLPSFARPCPLVPRHGFVDSIIVRTIEELKDLCERTFKEEPLGEIMLTPVYPSVHSSSIWTPTSLTVGAGHDGATAGKMTTSIPLVRTKFLKDLKGAKIGPTDDPYLEAICIPGESNEYAGWGAKPTPTFETILTQLRAGERMEGFSHDYVPVETLVRRIIPAEGDLIQWEAAVKGMGEGDVIWHPGGSPTDHYSVHARTHKIPVLTTWLAPPPLGSILAPIEGATEPDPSAVLKGLIVGNHIPLDRGRSRCAAHMILLGLHHSAVMGGDDGKWIGMAAALMLRLGSVALRGEARHIKSTDKLNRETVYSRHWNRTLSYHRAAVERLTNLFRYGEWSGGGIGGHNWALCGAALVPLFNSVRDLATSPSAETVGALIRSLNLAVSQAHNGGWWMNKFCNQKALDWVQQGHPGSIVIATPLVQEAGELFRSFDQKAAEIRQSKWMDWPVTTVRPMKIEKAEMFIIPGLNGIQFNLKTRFAGRNYRRITVSLDKLAPQLGPVLGPMKVVPSDTGWQIICEPPLGPPIVLYADRSLEVKARVNSALMEEDEDDEV